MPTLHLGVLDLPYVEAPPPAKKPPKRAPRRPRPHKAHAKKFSNNTTGDVAEILEAKYHVMELFWELHQDDIAEDFADSLSGAIETFIMGGPVNFDVTGTATSRIEDRFKQMLSLRELDALGYPGIPTAAAEHGVSHRFKRARQKRAARPSFVDTGLYASSFKAWVD